jgi:hypothetical protein
VAEYAAFPLVHVALGCVQEPDTLLKCELPLADRTAT